MPKSKKLEFDRFVEEIKQCLTNPNIELHEIIVNSKASEQYISVTFTYPTPNDTWKGALPFHYRRQGIEIDDPLELAQFIEAFYDSCENHAWMEWVRIELELWNTQYARKKDTKPFFEKLLNLEWNCREHALPRNPNPARRIQDVKDAGYFVCTNTNRFCDNCEKFTTHDLLVPVTKGVGMAYEVFSDKLKQRVISVLGSRNVYEDRVVPAASRGTLIPDHKFPEIRWDAETKTENPDTMTDQEIRQKFQLLTNQRNLQKREVCRDCFQTNKRGKVYGIDYYYLGDENWPSEVPKRGKDAERGCVGCPWYDLQQWRESLNALLKRQ